MSTVPPRKTRNRAATTAAIERATVDLAQEQDLERVTVDMICERAGVSQRTFFNHFATKDAAVLGASVPRINERQARSFAVSSGPLLAEALQLVEFAPEDLADPQLFRARLRALRRQPHLMLRQMERFASLESELAEITLLRLGHTDRETPVTELHEQARLITHMLSGVFRYYAESATTMGDESATVAPDPRAAMQLLSAVTAKIG